MLSPENQSEKYPSISTWQNVSEWAKTHYRDRVFRKDEQIPTRPQLIYLVVRGAVRLVGRTQDRVESEAIESEELEPEQLESFLGFIGAKKPFEIVAQSSFNINAFAHVDRTHVVWLYWQDLEQWPDFRLQLYEAFRYQHQRKLLWLSALGQRKTIDRLIGFLTLLVDEYGVEQGQMRCLPYSLTHAQIGSAIGSTRVTVTRLMGKLRRQGIILVRDDNSICIDTAQLAITNHR